MRARMAKTTFWLILLQPAPDKKNEGTFVWSGTISVSEKGREHSRVPLFANSIHSRWTERTKFSRGAILTPKHWSSE